MIGCVTLDSSPPPPPPQMGIFVLMSSKGYRLEQNWSPGSDYRGSLRVSEGTQQGVVSHLLVGCHPADENGQDY